MEETDYNVSDTQRHGTNKKNILEKIITFGKKEKKKILNGAKIVILAGGIIGGINSVSNNGKYELEGKVMNYFGDPIKEEITLKDVTNRKFGVDYVEVRYNKKEGKLKIKYSENRRENLKRMKYDGKKIPKNSLPFKEGEKRFEKIKRYMDWEKGDRAKKIAEELREPISLKD